MDEDEYLRWMWPRRIADIVKARAAFEAAAVPTRIANILIYSLGLRDPAELRATPWEDTGNEPGLRSRLMATPGVGPKMLRAIHELHGGGR